MSSTLSFLSRLASTPMTSLLRGRLAPSRRQLRDQLVASGLPEPTQQLIGSVVKRTKLWRIERADVQAELIAHFRDGIDAGATHDDLVRKFGDAETAAKLIRRAKIRSRSTLWHAKRWLIRGTLAIVAIYGLLFLRFMTGAPKVSTDFVAELNVPVLRVPEEARGWPIYREVIAELRKIEWDRRAAAQARQGVQADLNPAVDLEDLEDLRPGDARFGELVAFVDAHRPMLDKISVASRRESFGFVLGRDGGSRDLNEGQRPGDPNSDEATKLVQGSLARQLLPHLNFVRWMALYARADARVAAWRGDSALFVDRINAVLGLGRQMRQEPFMVSALVGVGVDALALEALAQQLASDPELLSDAQLVALAHQLGSERTAFDLIGEGLRGERAFFLDVAQRTFTDDGHGDGRFARTGPAVIDRMQQDLPADRRSSRGIAAQYGLFFAIASRKEMLALHAELFDAIEADFRTPYRDLVEGGLYERRLELLRSDATASLRFEPLLSNMPSLSRSAVTAERRIAKRDALQVVIACELHKRRTGAYPTTLDELRPELLPEVPIDPVDGRPIRYAVRDGKPFIYSIGADGDDDGGSQVKASEQGSTPTNYEAALGGKASIDADWILFPESREADVESPTKGPVATTRPISTTQRVDR